MRILKQLATVIIVIAVVFIALLFLVENDTPLTIDWFFAQTALSTGTWLLLSFVVGALIGLLSASTLFLRLLNSKRQRKKALSKSELALEQLRHSSMSR